MKEVFPGVFSTDGKVAVENSVPGYRPFDEEIIRSGKKEFRVWEPTRSKLAAALVKGLKEFPIALMVLLSQKIKMPSSI